MMWLVVIEGSGMSQRAFLHHGGQWPLSEGHWAVIWWDLRCVDLVHTCLDLLCLVPASLCQTLSVLNSRFHQILSSCVMLRYCSVLAPFREPFESKVQRHLYHFKADRLLQFSRLMGNFWYFTSCQVVMGWSRELSAISIIRSLYGHLGQGQARGYVF